MADEKEARFRQRGKDLKPLPGLDRILTWSASLGLKTAVVTNAPRKNAEFMLHSLSLGDYFPIVVLAEDVPQGKPHPDTYQAALDQLAVSAENAIAFEDSPSGVRSAVAAQIDTVGVASTHSPLSLEKAGAMRVISDFTEESLWKWLQSLTQS